VTGLAKLEYRPEAEFMRLFVVACMARHFEGFNPQDLANVINGEYRCTAEASVVGATSHLRVTGLAKLEYRPEAEFMRLFVATCVTLRFEGFKPQNLSNVINGELVYTAEARVDCRSERRGTCVWQAWRSWSTGLRRSS
jgi:hypothetical protein